MIELSEAEAVVVMEGLAVCFSEGQGDYTHADEVSLAGRVLGLYPGLAERYSYLPSVKECTK